MEEEYEGMSGDSGSEDEEIDYTAVGRGEDGEERMVIDENPTSVRDRIDQNLEVLANLKGRRAESTHSRSDLIATLTKDLSEYFGYLPELSQLFCSHLASLTAPEPLS